MSSKYTIMSKYIQFQDLILHEDEDILVINKPQDMASLDDKSNKNVLGMAKKYNPDLQLCHRLDKMTSGILLLSKKEENYRHISIQFEKRQVHKKYLALVAGTHAFKKHEVNYPLLVSTNKKVTVSQRLGKPSNTFITSLRHFKHYTLLECEPVTGRMHQIRVHLASIMLPIIGDELYGGKDMFLSEFKKNYKIGKFTDEESPLNHGYLLHSHSLEFTHPGTEEIVKYEAPLNKNFEAVIKTLEKYDL